MRKLALLLIGIALALPIILAQVQIQTFISFQGKLANASTGDPMTPASLRINVTEYNNLSAVVWGPVIYNNATDFQGIFDIVLGRNSTLNLTPGKDYQIIVCVDQDAVTYAACDFVYGDGTASGGLIIANAGGIRDASQLFLIDNSTSVQEIINQIITNISNIQGGMSHFFVDTGDIATQNLTTAIILNVSDLYAKTLNVTGNVNVTGAINAYNISNFNARIISLNSSTLLKAVQNNTDFIPNTLNITRIGITSLDGGSVNLVADQRADPLNQMTLYAESQSYDYSVRNIGVYGKGVLDYAAINGNQLTIGVLGNASNNVEATGTGYGVMGIAYYQGGAPYSFGTGAGVYGTSDNLYGVQGVSSSNYGVIGQSTSSYSGYFTLGRGVLIDRSLNVSNGLTVDSGTLYVNAGKNVVNITGDLGVSGTVFAHNYSSNSPITFSNASNGERLAVIDDNGNLRVITGGLCVGDGCSAESTPGNAVAQLSIYRNQSAAVEVLRPNGAGSATGNSKTGAPTNWETVDEEILDVNDNVFGAGSSSFTDDLYALQDSQIGNGVISSVKVYMAATLSGGQAKTMVRTNSNTYYGSTETLTSSYVTYSTTYSTNPQTGSAWTWSEINAMEVGVSLYAEDVSLPGTSMISTPGGLKRIMDLITGDEVYSYDGQYVVEDLINNVTIHKGLTLTHIVINDQLDVTANHEVYTTRGYVRADSLEIGDMLLSDTLEEIPVHSLSSYVSNETVYDLIVRNNPNFFAEGLLVHNAGAYSRAAHVYVEVTYTGPVSVTRINGSVIEFGSSRIDTNGSSIFKGDVDVHGATALGYGAYANDTGAAAFGRWANATGQSAIAIGSNAKSNGSTSVAIGPSSVATGTNTIALGNAALVSGSGSVAIGTSASVEATSSVGISLGSMTELTQANTLAIMGGKVGIGTVTPFATLDVAGDVNGTVYYDRDNSSFRVNPNNVSEMKRIWVTDTLSVGNGGRHVSYSDAMTQQVSFQILSTRTKPGVEYGFTANVYGTYDDGAGATVTQVYAGDFVATLSDPDNAHSEYHGAAGFTGTGASPGPATAIGAIGRISNNVDTVSPTNGAGIVGFDNPNISNVFLNIEGAWAAWFGGNVATWGNLRVINSVSPYPTPDAANADGDLYVQGDAEIDGLPTRSGVIYFVCYEDSTGKLFKSSTACNT